MTPWGVFRYKKRIAIVAFKDDDGAVVACRALGTRESTFEDGLGYIERQYGTRPIVGKDMKSECVTEEDCYAYLEAHPRHGPKKSPRVDESDLHLPGHSGKEGDDVP